MPHFNEEKCTKDHILIKEGDLAEKVFIIKSGAFMVTKKLIHKFKEEDNI